MGALLSGILGAAGADIEKQADRRYQEKRQERLDQMRILELAISNPQLASEHPEQIPKLFEHLQEIADDAKYKSPNKSIKDPMVKIGQFAGHLFQRKKQQQQQQGQQQQFRADVQGAPGMTAQPQQPVAPGPQSAAPQTAQAPQAAQTAPMPTSRFGSMPTREELQARAEAQKDLDEKRAEAAAKRTREGALDLYGKERSVDESLNVGTESRHYRQVQDRVEQLKKQNPDMPIEDIYAIAQGKAPTTGGKAMKGDIMPDADSPTGFSRIMMNHRGDIVGMERGILPPAGWAPSTSKTLRFVPQADGTYKAMEVATTRTRDIPGLPPSRVGAGAAGGAGAVRNGASAGGGGAAAGGVARPGMIVGQRPPGEGEMAIAHGAQGAMESAARMAKELDTLPTRHPMLTGQTMGRVASLGGHLNAIPGDMRQILADKDSVAAFTMGIHRARGRGYADKWAEVIGDPFINPAATKAVVQRIGKIAEAVQKRILSSSRYKPITEEDVERQMDKEGAFDFLDQPPPTGGASRTSPDMPDMINTPFGPAKRGR